MEISSVRIADARKSLGEMCRGRGEIFYGRAEKNKKKIAKKKNLLFYNRPEPRRVYPVELLLSPRIIHEARVYQIRPATLSVRLY